MMDVPSRWIYAGGVQWRWTIALLTGLVLSLVPVSNGAVCAATFQEGDDAWRASLVVMARFRKQSAPPIQAMRFWENRQSDYVANPIIDPERRSLVRIPQDWSVGVAWDDSGSIATLYTWMDDPLHNEYWAGVWDAGSQSHRWYPAMLQAADSYSQLAVLRVDGLKLPPIRRAAPDAIRIGEAAQWIGWMPDHLRTMRWGTSPTSIRRWNAWLPDGKSRRSRDANDTETLLELGALAECLEPAEAGHYVMVNGAGEFVGFDYRRDVLDDSPSGYAIVWDQTMARVIPELVAGKTPAYGFLGIQPEDSGHRDALDEAEGVEGSLPLKESGIRIQSVVRGMPGDLAGLRDGDRLMAIEGRPVRFREDLFRELSRHAADAEIAIDIQRGEGVLGQVKNLPIRARLSKKHIATRRPGYATNADQGWRGMRVEYATALPPEMMRLSFRVQGGLGPGSLAILDVEPQSAAWNAGLRSGQLINTVAGEIVSTPSEFYEHVSTLRGEAVAFQIISHRERVEEILVKATE